MKQTITTCVQEQEPSWRHGARGKGLCWTCYYIDINVTQAPPHSLFYCQHKFFLYIQLKFSREKIVLIQAFFFFRPAHVKAMWGFFCSGVRWSPSGPGSGSSSARASQGPRTFSSNRMWNTAGPWLHTCSTSSVLTALTQSFLIPRHRHACSCTQCTCSSKETTRWSCVQRPLQVATYKDVFSIKPMISWWHLLPCFFCNPF